MALQGQHKKLMLLSWVAVPLCVGLYLFLSPFLSPPVEPGTIANPKLAELLNESLAEANSRMAPSSSPGRNPEAAANSRVFLTEVSEVVIRCSKGPRAPHQKHNRMEYHVLRTDGVRYAPVSVGACGRNPFIFRAVFKGGRVVEAFTDGSERQYPVARVRAMVADFGEHVTWSDAKYHPARYFAPEPAAPTQADIAKEWE